MLLFHCVFFSHSSLLLVPLSFSIFFPFLKNSFTPSFSHSAQISSSGKSDLAFFQASGFFFWKNILHSWNINQNIIFPLNVKKKTFLYGKRYLHMLKCNFLSQTTLRRLSIVMVFIIGMVHLSDCLLLLRIVDNMVFSPFDSPMKWELYELHFPEEEIKTQRG